MFLPEQIKVIIITGRRTDLGADRVRDVLTRFEDLAAPLGHQVGVQLEGVDDPFELGQATLFVNRPTVWSADPDGDDDVPGLVPVIPGGIRMHQDEKLVPDANRLMELWKGAAKTKTGEPGVTSLGLRYVPPRARDTRDCRGCAHPR